MFYYEIDFTDCEPSEAVRKKIEKKLERLQRFYDRIISCHVTVRIPHLHRVVHFYHIQIRLEIPEKVFLVNREPGKNYAHTDINVAIRDAFNKLTRQLEDFTKHRKERPRPKVAPPHGKVKMLNPQEGYGFVVTKEGEEIYFHENSIVGDNITQLHPGMEVRFEAEMGEKGPQVTSMQVVGRS